MKLSPASRLVAVAVASAFVVLAIVGSVRPPTDTGISGAAVTPSDDGGSSQIFGSDAVGQPSRIAIASPTSSAGSTTESHGTATPRPIPRPTPRPPSKSTACKPTNQDRYVYNPTRLSVQAACIRVTGTVEAVRHEADGDFHILLALDSAYRRLLRPANQGEELGDLVVEPICVHSVTQTDAKAVCASDPDPLHGPFPVVGQSIWMEGRYVFDLDHGGWAELHPLYRWGTR